MKPLPSFVRNLIKQYPHPPLPTAEELASLFHQERYPHLQPQHILDITSWVLDETKRSRDFGLYFDINILCKEAIFFLVFVNSFGGVAALKYKLNSLNGSQYEQFSQEVANVHYSAFIKESSYFFKRLTLTQETLAPNAFDCHLFSVRTTVLQKITNYAL